MANYIIIGASSGIVKKLSEKLAVAGHQVYGTYNNNELQPENNLIQLFPLRGISLAQQQSRSRGLLNSHFRPLRNISD